MNIVYNIECTDIKKQKNGEFKIQISGWVFSKVEKSVIEISLVDITKEEVHISNSIDREDVYDVFHKIPESLKSGFHVVILSRENYSNVKINFKVKSLDENIIVPVEIPKYESQPLFTLKNAKKILKSIKINGITQTFKIILSRVNNNNTTNKELVDVYTYKEVSIPHEWINIQRYKPLISIIIPIKDFDARKQYLYELQKSINAQVYKNYELVWVYGKDEKVEFDFAGEVIKVEIEEAPKKGEIIKHAIKFCNGEYITIVEQEDKLSKNMLAHFIEQVNQHPQARIIYFNEDRFLDDNEFFCPIYKELLLKDAKIGKLIYNAAFFSRNIIKDIECYNEEELKYLYSKIDQSTVINVNKIVYHKRVVQNIWDDDERIKSIAFYLPQFHEIPENNEWWGDGFTEWTNTKKAYPLFKGHHQKRIPTELGYYNIVEDESIQIKQNELAKKYGIYGFCYYYYWFNGKRLLEKPLNRVLNDKRIDMPFCICWANENWTRRWDGMETEILIEQKHNEESDINFINDVIPILKDERYIKINGAPVLLIYRASLFSNIAKTIDTWRKICCDQGIDNIHISFVLSTGLDKSNLVYLADSCVEFPPHNINVLDINEDIKFDIDGFKGRVSNYEYSADVSIEFKPLKYKLHRGCMLQWDNTARRKKSAHIFHMFSLNAYKKWLYKCCEYTKYFYKVDESFVFINAWNEWAEGTYLEPDEKYGYGYLESTKEMLNSR